MANIVQDAEGRWKLNELYVEGITEDLKFDVTLSYSGQTCRVENVSKNVYSKNIDTGWVTPLGEPLDVTKISFESKPVYSSDGKTKYIIEGINLGVAPYDPTVTGNTKANNTYISGLTVGEVTHELVIDNIANLSGSGTIKPTATYVVKVNGEITNQTAANNCVWESGNLDVGQFDENGNLNYSNEGTTTKTLSISCTYNDTFAEKTIVISTGEEKTDGEHEVVLEYEVSGGTSEPYPYSDDKGILNFTAKYYDIVDGQRTNEENITEFASWTVSNPIAKIHAYHTVAPMTWLNTKDTVQTVEVFVKYNGYKSNIVSFTIAPISDDAKGDLELVPSSEQFKNTVLPSQSVAEFKSYFTLGDIIDNDVTSETEWSVDNSNVAVINSDGVLEWCNNGDMTQTFSVIGKYTFNNVVYTKTTTMSVCAKNAKDVSLTFYVNPKTITSDEEHPYGYVRISSPSGKESITEDFDEQGVAKITGKYQVGTVLSYTVIKKGYHDSIGTYTVADDNSNGIMSNLIPSEESVNITRELEIWLDYETTYINKGGQYLQAVLKTFANGEKIEQRNVTRQCTLTSESSVFERYEYSWGKILFYFNNPNKSASQTLKLDVHYEDLTQSVNFIVPRFAAYDYTKGISVYGDRKRTVTSSGIIPGDIAYYHMYYNGTQPKDMIDITKNVQWIIDDGGTGIVTGHKTASEGDYIYYNNTTPFDIPIRHTAKSGNLADAIVYIIPGVREGEDTAERECAYINYPTGKNITDSSASSFISEIISNTEWRFVRLSNISAVSADIADIDWIQTSIEEGVGDVDNIKVTLPYNDTGSERYGYLAVQSKKTNKILSALYIRQSA